ncbi:MAG: cytochrome c [Pseudomonadota bacterium]
MRYRIWTSILLSGALAACGGDDTVSRGAALYQQNCALCHGGDLRGGGGAGIEGLSRTPSDLTVLARDAGSIFPRAEVLTILESYSLGVQTGRIMRPLTHLTSEEYKRIKTSAGRARVPAPQAALLAYLESVQSP